MSKSLSEEEVKQYDRQLRLWGMTAQTRLLSSNVLIVNIGGLAAEVTKNVVLAGIGRLTILDSHVVQPGDLGSQFFLSEDSIGQNRATASLGNISVLNPRVEVSVDTDDVDSKPASFFLGFDVVFLTNCSLATQVRINQICRSTDKNIYFMAAETFGWYGYMHSDLHNHQYTVTEDKNGETTKREERVSYPSLSHTTAMSWKQIADAFGRKLRKAGSLYLCFQVIHHFRQANKRLPTSPEDFARCEALAQEKTAGKAPLAELRAVLSVCECELNPVCAVLGGLLGSEVLKLISGQDKPWGNVMIYNAQTSDCVTHVI